ncbi:MAG: ABC transporter permease [Verrucomicrobiia bacterium]
MPATHKSISFEELKQKVKNLLNDVGLQRVADRPARLISGGQKRRLALAMELASAPTLLLCDEVTSGLDPQSETEILNLLHQLAQQKKCLILNVTHSLNHLELYDSITVLYQGHLAYHGPSAYLLTHFGIHHPENLFPTLLSQTPENWSAHHWTTSETESHISEENREEMPTIASPLRQFFILLKRRLLLFYRDRSQFALHLLLLFLFPSLVVLFAYRGLPQIQNLNMGQDINLIQQLKETVMFTAQTSKIGSLVSGLILFQVILLTLMASNNAAREVVAERLLLEKEKLAGLHISSYLASKILFLSFLVLAQSSWMTLFVKTICRFPGPLLPQFFLLTLVNAAVTATCLAISSWSRTTEKASLISLYIVGFQLPLSGAVLALPSWLTHFVQPFIATYWSWSGMLQTMRTERLYDLVIAISETALSPLLLCYWVLGAHTLLAIFLAYLGCWRSAWDN